MPVVPAAHRRRIAIVQLDDGARDQLAVELAERGFEVTCYRNDGAAIEGERDAPPDLLVVDGSRSDPARLFAEPPLSATPVMLLSAERDAPESAPTGTVVVPRSLSPDALASSIERVFTRRASSLPPKSGVEAEQRLAALGLVTAGVVHEINNPLATVILNLGELRKAIRPAPHVRELLDDTVDAAERIRLIVRDIQDFARAREGHCAAVEVQHVLDSSLRLVRHHLRQRVHVLKEYAPAPMVPANDGRLSQLFVNLIVNASQAFPDRPAAENILRISTLTGPRGDCVVEIADNGVGIPPEHLERIFDLFFTTKPAGTGTGIGLSLCKSIVASLDGSIEVSSTPGRGTLFRVTLPAAVPGRMGRGRSGTIRVSAPRAPLRRVLLIDDDELLTRALVRGLSPHDVTVCRSAGEGLDALLADDRFHLVLCDVVMPDFSGLRLLEEVKAKRPGLERKIVFMTATHASPVLDRLAEEGMRTLFKPFEVAELCRLLEGDVS